MRGRPRPKALRGAAGRHCAVAARRLGLCAPTAATPVPSRTLPLRWEGERMLEMFTPDFYLPDHDLYIELTTLRQKLVTYKNRKLRQLRELYPDINIRLLYRKDYHRLLAKYGYLPLGDQGQ